MSNLLAVLATILYVVAISVAGVAMMHHKPRRPDYVKIHQLERELGIGSDVQQWIGNEFVIPARASLGQSYCIVIRNGHTYHQYEDGRRVLVKSPPPDKEPV
jgi:hypothetical protein